MKSDILKCMNNEKIYRNVIETIRDIKGTQRLRYTVNCVYLSKQTISSIIIV